MTTHKTETKYRDPKTDVTILGYPEYEIPYTEEDIGTSKPRPAWSPPIHQSDVKAALRCPRYYLYRRRWGLIPKQSKSKPSVALSLGKLVHRFMELGPDRTEEVVQEVEQDKAELARQIDEGEDLLGHLQKQIELLDTNVSKARAMVQVYWDKYGQAAHTQEVTPEQYFVGVILFSDTILDADLGIVVAGKIDQPVKTPDGWYVRDYKSTGQDIDLILAGYAWSSQCRLYRIGATMVTGQPPRGFMVDILRTPSIKFCKKDKDLQAYIERCKKWYTDKGDQAVRAFAVDYAEPLVPDELQKALLRVNGYRTAPPVPKYFPRDVTASYCTEYRRVCPYYNLCKLPKQTWDSEIDRLFDVVPPGQALDENTNNPNSSN